MQKAIYTKKSAKNVIIKILIFAVFFMMAIYVIRFTPLKSYLAAGELAYLLNKAGPWAPVLYILVYTFGVCLFVPGTLLSTLGVVLFGTYWGFLYVWIGAMLGASTAFFISRTLGRHFAASIIGDKLKKYDDAIQRNGFAAVLYLRLLYFPFTPLNFGMGLTKIRFRDYFMGTGIGIMAGTFIFTFFIGTLKEVWASGNWEGLLSFKTFFSLIFFIFSFAIPTIIKKIRKKNSPS